MAVQEAAIDTPAGAVPLTAEVRKRPDLRGGAFKAALLGALAFSLAMLVVLLAVVLIDGWPVLTGRLGEFLATPNRSRARQAGVFDALRGSFWIGLTVVVVAFPVGIGAAIYLEEYAPKNRLARFIDLNIRNLAGVPSVVYGILGFAVFVKVLRGLTGGTTVLAGGLTMAVLVLPIVIITAAEAIRAVPASLREGGYGVGATRWEVIRTLVLPYAAPGILTGTVLALARALGEAAPLLLVGAIVGRVGRNTGFFEIGQLRDVFQALPTLITDWAGEPGEFQEVLAPAAIVVMLVVVLLANATAILLRNRYEKRRHAV